MLFLLLRPDRQDYQGTAITLDVARRLEHRRLLAEFHPDRGGSESATREINAARDLLIEGLRRIQDFCQELR